MSRGRSSTGTGTRDAEIRDVHAREILDCRLEPTLRVTVETTAGSGTADVPAGKSTGRHEAVEQRDGGDRYRGKGVRRAVDTIESEVAPVLQGVDAAAQQTVDETLIDLDPTEQKEQLGGNVTTGVSLAAAKAGADTVGTPLYRHIADVRPGDSTVRLPIPVLDMIEGGELADSPLDFQEHQLPSTVIELFCIPTLLSPTLVGIKLVVQTEKWSQFSMECYAVALTKYGCR